MKVIHANNRGSLEIGYAGEKNRTEVRFYYGDLEEEFPGGTVLLQVRRPCEETKYDILLDMADDEEYTAVWLVSEYDCAIRGIGECQLIYTTTNNVAKKKVWRTNVNRSIEGSDTSIPPDWEDIYNKLASEAANIRNAIETVEDLSSDAAESAQSAQDSASQAANSASVSEQYAVSAGNSASFASGYAQNAQNSANTAAAEAINAQNSANTASTQATNAQNSANLASAHAEIAQNSANQAATQAANAQNSASMASTQAANAQNNANLARGYAQSAETLLGQYDNMTATASALPSSSDPTAEINHEGSSPVLMLGIPRGEKGEVGPQGPKGDDGEQGVQGEKGDTGESGVYVGTSQPTNSEIKVWLNPNGTPYDFIGELQEVKDQLNQIKTIDIHICTSSEYDAQTGVPTIQNPDSKTFYLVPGSDAPNLYVEWMYVNGAWERFGSATLDLSGYATKIDTVLETTLSRGRKEGTTVGTGSFAFGDNVEASSKASFAEGENTVASGRGSHAQGSSTIASGNFSHAEGSYTKATGTASHAEGWNANASGEIAHAEGNDTIAASQMQHVQGKFNVEDNQNVYADIIGNGTSVNARSNASALDWSGNLKLAGDVYVGANTDSTGGTKLAKTTDIPDVQIDGTSIVENGVANIPLASSSAYGVAKVSGAAGIEMINGFLTISSAQSQYIQGGTHARKAITPKYQHESTFYGLAKAAGDTTQSQSGNTVGTYTDEAKAAIRTMLDVPSNDEIPEVPVQDVQVNGTSILQDGVANVPLANASRYGVVRLDADYGTHNLNDRIAIQKAADDQCKNGVQQFRPIVAYNQHLATFYGLAKAAGADEKNSTLDVGQYTETAKSKISDMLNAPVSVSGTTPTINTMSGVRYICGEVSTLTIVLPESGIVDVTFQSGSTATVLTVTPPTGVTVKWANGFNPTSLDANTTYEINIMDGLGVVGSWS